MLEPHASAPLWRSGVARAAGALVLVGLGAALLLGALSDGVYHDDDICHYLFARDGIHNVNLLLHQWARPGYNLPTAVVAHAFGVAGTRVFSAVQTAVVAWLSFLIALRLVRSAGLPEWSAALAPLLVWAQPLTMTLAFTTLTETPAALYMALGVWLYLRGNRVWACAAFSAMFVTRYETMALGPILAVAVTYDALRAAGGNVWRALRTGWVWGSAAACFWAPLLYALAAYAAQLPEEGDPLRMFARGYSKEFGTGSPQFFLTIWPEAASLGVLILAATGAVRLHRRAWFPTALTVGLVALHSYLFWRGSFATGGYARFLVPLAGLLGALAAAGVGACWAAPRRLPAAALLLVAGGWWALELTSWGAFVIPPHLGRYWGEITLLPTILLVVGGALALVADEGVRRALARAGVVLAGGLIVAQVAVQVRPLSLLCDRHHIVCGDAVEAIAAGEFRDRPGLTQHVVIRFLRPATASAFSNEDALERWRAAGAGTLFFWDSKYCYKPHELPSTEALYAELHRLGRLAHESECDGARVQVFVRAPGEAPPEPATLATPLPTDGKE